MGRFRPHLCVRVILSPTPLRQAQGTLRTGFAKNLSERPFTEFILSVLRLRCCAPTLKMSGRERFRVIPPVCQSHALSFRVVSSLMNNLWLSP